MISQHLYLLALGYGHLAPTTDSGRIFCIFYALIGIPLTWMLLARLGYMISCGVSRVISGFERRFLQREPSLVGLKSTLVTFLMAFTMILLIACIAHYSEHWTFLEGIYFGFITLSTIGMYVLGKTSCYRELFTRGLKKSCLFAK